MVLLWFLAESLNEDRVLARLRVMVREVGSHLYGLDSYAYVRYRSGRVYWASYLETSTPNALVEPSWLVAAGWEAWTTSKRAEVKPQRCQDICSAMKFSYIIDSFCPDPWGMYWIIYDILLLPLGTISRTSGMISSCLVSSLYIFRVFTGAQRRYNRR